MQENMRDYQRETHSNNCIPRVPFVRLLILIVRQLLSLLVLIRYDYFIRKDNNKEETKM